LTTVDYFLDKSGMRQDAETTSQIETWKTPFAKRYRIDR